MNKVKKSKTQNELDTQGYPEETLDTETTIADMNVEGMPWYRPKGQGGRDDLPQLTRKEKRSLLFGAFLAALPVLGVILLVMALLYGLAYVWLG